MAAKIGTYDRHENDGYEQMGWVLYLTEAYKRARRIAARYGK